MGKRETKKAEIHARLLELAQNMVAEEGWDSFTIRKLAQAAGVAVGTVYNYFPNKEAILLEEIEATLEEARNQMAGAVELEEAPIQNVATLYCILFDALTETPAYVRLILHGLLDDNSPAGERFHELQEGFVRYLTSVLGILTSNPELPEEDLEAAARGIHNLWLALLPRWLTGRLNEDQFLEEHLATADLILRGLLAPNAV